MKIVRHIGVGELLDYINRGVFENRYRVHMDSFYELHGTYPPEDLVQTTKCGTAACIAGHAVVYALDKGALTGVTEVGQSGAYTGDELHQDIWELASALLDLNDAQATYLFQSRVDGEYRPWIDELESGQPLDLSTIQRIKERLEELAG